MCIVYVYIIVVYIKEVCKCVQPDTWVRVAQLRVAGYTRYR